MPLIHSETQNGKPNLNPSGANHRSRNEEVRSLIVCRCARDSRTRTYIKARRQRHGANGNEERHDHQGDVQREEGVGVIAGFDETDTTVRFPFSSENNTVEVVEIVVRNSECRKPKLGQDSELATFIRQLTAWDENGH